MPKGGHAHSGPAPDPNALRREHDKGEWVTLPAAGRPGPTPAWPLTKPTVRETDLWVRLWTKPQALMWERFDQIEEVAMYVRRLRAAEKPNAPAASFTPVRQLADSLGLTTPGMRANRWKIAQAVDASRPPAVAHIESARERLRVVAEDAVERP